MRYVSLHHHTTYSYMDGFGLPEDHVKRAAELGYNAIAFTEHGNVSSHVKGEQAGLKYGVKPVFGLEAYTAPVDMRETQNQRKWHLTLLAENLVGYRNLMRMVTRSWDEGFYRWPTVTWDILRDNSEGIIALSGCADSKLACDLLGGKGREHGDINDAIRTLKAFKRLFGDRFYLETQQFPELQRTRWINEAYEMFSKKYGVPLAATSDVHYPHPDDNEMQKILHAAGRNTGTVAAAEAEWEYDIRLTLPLDDKFIIDRLVATDMTRRGAMSAVYNTEEIAQRCNVELPKMDRVRYPLELEPNYTPGMTTEKLIREWLNRGWRYRGFNRLPIRKQREYKERAEYELGLMSDKDFLDYFLVLSDVVSWCKDQGVPVGPARGSAAASIVCYLLRITEVNPMDFPLMLFERFIAPDRYDLPDVDLDFDDELRDMVRQRMVEKYGEDRVGNIGTFTRYRGKNAIDDVARVYAIPRYEAESAKDFLVERSGGDARFDASIEDTIEMFPKVREIFDRNPDLYKSMRLEGNYKSFGVHAAGVVIGAEPLWNYVASHSRTMADGRKLQVLSVDKYDGEHLGLLKLDALGLKTMGMIRIALEMTGMSLEDLYQIPLDDKATMDSFHRADVTGIFQFEGRTTRMVTEWMKPTTFMDLAAINALSRPGPYNSGTTFDYIAVRRGDQEREHLHPIVDRITEATDGQIVYQEQILAICREVGKFPWTHASTIRKVISQKKGEAAFNELWDNFKEGANSQGIDDATADKIWRHMVTSGTYAFNVAHSISYSMLGFWSMWLKVHHPLAFYAAQLIKTAGDKDKQLALMRDMMDERYGRSYQVYPPDIQTSGETWGPTSDGVVAGFSQIPGIGMKMAPAICSKRDDVGMRDWEDLVLVQGIGPKKMEMIMSFCLSEDPFEIHKIQRETAAIRKSIKDGELMVPMPDTLAEQINPDPKRADHVVLGVLKARNLQDLFENHRARTGKELDAGDVRDPDLKDYITLYLEDESGTMLIKLDRWTYPRYKGDIWSAVVDHDYVLAKCIKRAHFGKKLSVVKMWVIDPD